MLLVMFATLSPAGRGGEGMKSTSFCSGGSEESRKGGADAASVWSNTSTTNLESTSTAVGQQLQFVGSSSSSLLLRRLLIVLVSISRAVGQPLPPCLPTSRRKVLFLLLRRFSSFETACSLCYTPSGNVPGGTAVGRTRKLWHGRGGEGARRCPGPDCFLYSCPRVFFVLFKGLVVISLSLGAPFYLYCHRR